MNTNCPPATAAAPKNQKVARGTGTGPAPSTSVAIPNTSITPAHNVHTTPRNSGATDPGLRLGRV